MDYSLHNRYNSNVDDICTCISLVRGSSSKLISLNELTDLLPLTHMKTQLTSANGIFRDTQFFITL